jgi:hypothetical protein
MLLGLLQLMGNPSFPEKAAKVRPPKPQGALFSKLGQLAQACSVYNRV